MTHPPAQITAFHCPVCDTFKLYNFGKHRPHVGPWCSGIPQQVNYTQTRQPVKKGET